MQKLLLIYNPVSGAGTFSDNLDECVRILQTRGFLVSLYRTERGGDIESLLCRAEAKAYSTIAAAGGDGTINRVVNAMVRSGIKKPLGIICAGTANDLARHIGVTPDFRSACRTIAARSIKKMDLGAINGEKYFVNVCAAGMFANISQCVDQELKNSFGKLAYYIKGLEQIQNPMPLKVRIATSTEVIEEELLLFVILNSARLGGIRRMCPTARIDDGLFDFIGFRCLRRYELPALLLKVLSGGCLSDKRIFFRRDNFFRVELAEPAKTQLLSTDIDGEPGPKMPIVVQNMPEALEIIAP